MSRSSQTRSHFSPPSSDRNSPPFSASMIAYTRCELEGAIATPTLPQMPEGRPLLGVPPGADAPGSPGRFFRLFHVSPPSRETYRSEPGPPLISSHGRRRASQNPAKITRGLFGSIATSEQPAYSFLWSTRCHVLPPSVVR